MISTSLITYPGELNHCVPSTTTIAAQHFHSLAIFLSFISGFLNCLNYLSYYRHFYYRPPPYKLLTSIPRKLTMYL